MARKFLLWFALLLTISVSGMFYLILKDPRMRELKNLRVDSTPERIARGEYLANHLLSCVHCHTQRDHNDYSLPAVGPAFAGDCLMRRGLSGKMCMPNITWMRKRARRVDRRRVAPGIQDRIAATASRCLLMPFDAYAHLPDEDAYAPIAYLRTIPAVTVRRRDGGELPDERDRAADPDAAGGTVPAVSGDNEVV
jgi:hypothetical protein